MFKGNAKFPPRLSGTASKVSSRRKELVISATIVAIGALLVVSGCKSETGSPVVIQPSSGLPMAPETKSPQVVMSGGTADERSGDHRLAPIATRFIGGGCVAMRDGSTWCPEPSTNYTHFRRLSAREPLNAVVFDTTGIGFQLGQSGKVYVCGKSESDTDPKRSLDYTNPQLIPGLEHVAVLAGGAGYVALDATGALWSWTVAEHRNEELLVVSVEVAPPKVVRRGVKTLWAQSGLCLIAEEGMRCNNDGDLAGGHWSTPSEIASWTPDLGFVSHANTCFYGSKQGLHCYAGWTLPGNRQVELAGHYVLDIRPAKIGFEHILDVEGRLFSFTNPRSLENHDIQAPTPRHLAHLGRVADFDGGLCVISEAGQLACRGDGRVQSEPVVPVVFDVDATGIAHE